MADDVVIRAEALGKQYMIGHRSAERTPTLRDALARGIKSIGRTAGNMLRGNALVAGDQIEEFWALRDVDFEVRRGDVVGIIGGNGAGKSTLLKVLSRITEPSAGRVEIRGRVASLLEVGTGFHPELTGRENIFLNGAILGMTRAEVKRKFDEIVDFAGVERFLDTPVKRYSSGMYVRLAFAVAAHLEPEILIVDEVLAVGDAEFQSKCLGKMQDVAGHGRTVLFVSHNMAGIESLCSRAIVLKGGQKISDGATKESIARYLQQNEIAEDINLADRQGKPIMTDFCIRDSHGRKIRSIGVADNFVAEISGNLASGPKQVTMNIRIDTILGERATTLHTHYQSSETFTIEEYFRFECRVSNFRLIPGSYQIYLILQEAGVTIDEAGPIPFEITPRDIYGSGRMINSRTGMYLAEVDWRHFGEEAAASTESSVA